MNLDANPTPGQLRQLLAPCDDRAGNHLLWVRKTGEVELSRLPRGTTPEEFERSHPDMQFHYAPFLAAYEYVGADAAADDEWVQELFDSLLREWQRARGKTEVALADKFW